MDEVDVQIISALLCFCKNLSVVLWDEAWYLSLDFARLAVLVRDECEEWLAVTVSISVLKCKRLWMGRWMQRTHIVVAGHFLVFVLFKLTA